MVLHRVNLAILFSLLGYVNATLLRVSDFQYILELYGKNAKVLSLQPPILLIDGFVRPKEIQYLLQSKSILSKLDRGRVAGNQNVAKRTSATHFLSSKEGQVRFVRRLGHLVLLRSWSTLALRPHCSPSDVRGSDSFAHTGAHGGLVRV